MSWKIPTIAPEKIDKCIQAAHTLIADDGRCSSVSCAVCPGSYVHGPTVDCVEGGFVGKLTKTGDPNKAIVKNCKRFIKRYEVDNDQH